MKGIVGKILTGISIVIALVLAIGLGVMVSTVIRGESPKQLAEKAGTDQIGEKNKSDVLDLSGEWKQTNSESDDSYHGIYISDDTIEIYWVSESEETSALYWAGSFTPPTSKNNKYEWESKNDKSKTATAIMASDDDTKDFSYKNGKLSYSASAFGVDTVIEAEQQDWGYSDKISINTNNSNGSPLDSISFEKHAVTSGVGNNYLFDIAVANTTKDVIENVSSDELTAFMNSIDFSGTNGNAVLMFEDGTGLSISEIAKTFSADYGYIDVSEGEFTMVERLGAIWNDTGEGWYYMTVEEMQEADSAQ